MRHLQRSVWLLAILLVAACSKDKVIDEPAKLTVFTPALKVHRLWGASIDDKKAADLRLGLGVSVAEGRLYAAGHKGDVTGFDLQTGKTLWHKKLKAPLSGGTAASADLVLVGSSNGHLFALAAADGQLRWDVQVKGEVLAPPAISEKLIAIRTGDGKLRALSPADGHELWQQEQQVPKLSLRGTATPVISGDVVLCGFDNGKVVAMSASDGSVQWEVTVTPPHGRTELERLSDIDSSVIVSGQNVYAVGFQGKVAMLALDTGQVWWSHEASSARGMSIDADTLYISTSDGEIIALRTRTGAELWRQNALLYRRLSAPGAMDEGVVLADFDGYVHWLDKTSGAIIARERGGKVRVSTAPVVSGNMVAIINDRGQLNVYRVTPLAASGKKSAATDSGADSAPAPAQDH
jgi:outer membrane protein assembly factor BamB